MCTCSIVAVGFADCDGLVWQDAIDNMQQDTNHIIPSNTTVSLPQHVYHSHTYTNEQYAVQTIITARIRENYS